MVFKVYCSQSVFSWTPIFEGNVSNHDHFQLRLKVTLLKKMQRSLTLVQFLAACLVPMNGDAHPEAQATVELVISSYPTYINRRV